MKLRVLLIANVVVLAGAATLVPRSFFSFSQAKKTSTLELKDGDILFQSMGGRQGDAVALATKCEWTHVGIAFKDNNEWMVYEAVGPVKKTSLAEWIDQGDGHYVVKRWNEAAQKLDAAAISKLRGAATPYMGKAYDLQFLWSDEKIYCSELVWKMYEEGLGVRLCEPKALKDYQLDSELVQRMMKERYGSAPPMDEPMVAPATLFECALLVTVVER